jgi:hypothetical protein
MSIYDPISDALGIPPNPEYNLIDLSEYSREPVPPWNKGQGHVEGQTESLKMRLANGSHNFIKNRMIYARKRVENGSYSKVSKRTARKQVADGTHPFLHYDVKGQQLRLLNEGKHHSQKEHICPHCGKIGRGNTMKRHHFDNCKSIDTL